MADEKTISFGEKSVGLDRNHYGDADMLNIKRLYADIINQLNDKKTPLMGKFRPGGPVNSENNRLISIAITEAQGACMWAVRALTWE